MMCTGTEGCAIGRAEAVSKILYLRQHYHFGPGRIADDLKRFHQVSVARSSVHRILGKHGMPRLPANQKHRPHGRRWQRYEKPQPGHRLQMGREVPGADSRHGQAPVPVHRDRRWHAHPRAQSL